MTDVHDHDDGDQGDGPDTFDDRLAGLRALVDALADERDEVRRALHRRIAVRLLTRLAAEALTRISEQLDRLDDDDDGGG